MVRVYAFALFSAFSFIVVPPAYAQAPIALEGVVITADRVAESAEKVGSAVSVISREQIEASRAENVAELLEQIPGLTVNQSGGVGGSAAVSIRGAESDQTLVLIDGVRVNDPASTGSEFDFAVFSLANVERIEIIRGPQSGLYGGDAIGGVINILTRKGEGEPNAIAEVEGGSYGTFAQRAYAGGSKGDVAVSVAASNFYTSGFSRYSGGVEDDATRKQSINARLDYDPSPIFGVTVTAGRYTLDADLDSVGLRASRDAADYVDRVLTIASATARLNLFDGRFQNKLTAFMTDSDRLFFDDDGARGGASPVGRTSTFEGTSRGFEYQGDVAVRTVDRLIFGGKIDRQSGLAVDEDTLFGVQSRYDVEEVWRSAFTAYSFNPFEALNLTGAVRIDEFGPAGTAGTYRLTAAYRVADWGTKFRSSYGTGAKAPTIQQRFEDSDFAKGNPDLQVETSRGFDAGVDQELFQGQLTLSGTYFANRIKNLITVSGIEFVNIGDAEIDGIELAATLKPVSWVMLLGSYTHLDAIDAKSGLKLPRRPDDAFNVRLTLLPMDALKLWASASFVGERFNRSDERDPLDDYIRVDLGGSYALSAEADIFLRAENIFDAEYEEIKDFGTAGRSAYMGLRARF